MNLNVTITLTWNTLLEVPDNATAEMIERAIHNTNFDFSDGGLAPDSYTYISDDGSIEGGDWL